VANIVQNRYPQDPAPRLADLLDPLRTGRVWPVLLRNYWLVSGQPWWLLDYFELDHLECRLVVARKGLATHAYIAELGHDHLKMRDRA
jgi:hypothetical protein